VRDALYMPALVAMRHNPDLKAKYQALINAGKPAKVALTALMRKLIELANALIKADRNWVKRGGLIKTDTPPSVMASTLIIVTHCDAVGRGIQAINRVPPDGYSY
jgi:hypothetical protein